ncbi:MAG: hypothetical protein ABDH32_07595 [Candidatus Caldarchaeales archaeon]
MRALKVIREAIVKLTWKLKPRTYVVKNLKGDTIIVSSTCRACRHPKRAEIDRMIGSVRDLKKVAETYEMSLEELVKHYNRHVVGVGERKHIFHRIFRKHFVKYIDLQEEFSKLIGRLYDLFNLLERFDEGSTDNLRYKLTPRDYIAMIDERRKILEDIRKTLSTMENLKVGTCSEKDITELFRRFIDRGIEQH